ncbi:hypothetical protein BT67DRAFT_85080 [Trichocladium antarcticum]|uniref:Uncharacterized protein n=1 Tax=Trichocladium antarcticum TaxID=1450529 RepID=A0AAN6UG72_9PEZI|nr:hypothetical protein BT67DRAFT_85080 [Trichocladium antarcticum]
MVALSGGLGGRGGGDCSKRQNYRRRTKMDGVGAASRGWRTNSTRHDDVSVGCNPQPEPAEQRNNRERSQNTDRGEARDGDESKRVKKEGGRNVGMHKRRTREKTYARPIRERG